MQTTVGELINNLSQLDLSTVMVLPPSLSALVAGTTTPVPAPAAAVVAPAAPSVATTAATQGPGVPSPTVGTLPLTAFAAVFRCPTCDAVHFMTPINNPPVSTSPPHTTASPTPAVVPAPPGTPAPASPSPTASPAPAVVPAPPSTPTPAPPSTPTPAPPSTPTPTPTIQVPPSTPSFPSMSTADSTNFGTPPSTPGNASSSTAGNNGRWYAVTYGRQIGVFRDWYGIVEPLVANVPNWKCRAFSTLAAATAHFNERVNAGAAGIYVD